MVAETTQPVLLTSKEVARLLAISERAVFSLAKSGQLPKVRFGAAVRYRRSDVLALVDRLAEASNDVS
jgi:excisionase family DNA binding protein